MVEGEDAYLVEDEDPEKEHIPEEETASGREYRCPVCCQLLEVTSNGLLHFDSECHEIYDSVEEWEAACRRIQEEKDRKASRHAEIIRQQQAQPNLTPAPDYSEDISRLLNEVSGLTARIGPVLAVAEQMAGIIARLEIQTTPDIRLTAQNIGRVLAELQQQLNNEPSNKRLKLLYASYTDLNNVLAIVAKNLMLLQEQIGQPLPSPASEEFKGEKAMLYEWLKLLEYIEREVI